MKHHSLFTPIGLVSLVLVLPHCSSDPEPAGDTTSTMSTTSGPSTSSTTTSTASSSATSTTGNATMTATSTTGSATTTSSSSGTGGAGGATSSMSSSSGGGAASTGTNTGTGAGGTGMGGSGGTGMTGGEFTLTSSELMDGDEMLDKHTCEGTGFGNDESPPFAWTGVPEGTLSFALIFLDIDNLPGSMGYHWAIWDIPGSITELPANIPPCGQVMAPLSCEEYAIDIGDGGYFGPCPGGTLHNYEFRLYALPTATAAESGVMGTTLNAAMVTAFENAALAEAVFHVTSDAQ